MLSAAANPVHMKAERTIILAIAAATVAAGLPLMPALCGETPSGSYSGSCSSIAVRGTTLEAMCTNARGWPVRASLANYDKCRGDIRNNDGRLEC
jgi:hypothetical protein